MMSSGSKSEDGQRYTWLDGLRRYWAILAGVAMIGVFFGDLRLGPLEVKIGHNAQDIDSNKSDIEKMEQRIEDHMKLGGHSVMEQRMLKAESELGKIESELEQVRKLLNMGSSYDATSRGRS